MTRSESFLARWSRRKAQSSQPADVSPVGRASGAAAEKPDEKEETPAASPPAGEPAQAAFDLASLPTIEAIAAATDVRPFLQSGVPAQLTQAALRRAWVSDPAIRDFIGIAENQWDFNDPTAMPGFGPLTAADQAATLAAQILGDADDRLAQSTEGSSAATPAMPEADSAIPGEPDDKLPQTPDSSAEDALDAKTVGLATKQDKGNIVAGDDSAPGESGARRNHRRHGRALPQ